MHWIAYLLISLPIAVLGLLGGGFIGDACVRWYRVSSFEGGSGYFVIGLALLGAVVGLITGLVTAGVLAPQNGAGYLKTFATSVGVLAGLAALITALCWSLADIPPEIDGRPLTLEVELRLPTGTTNPPTKGTGESSMALYSLVNHTGRKHESGSLRPQDARLENGRWIVPGEVALFTMRGKRSLDFKLNGETVMGFLVPLPARPGRKFLEWSDWLPRPPAPHPAWPDTKPSYRFRVQKIAEPPPAPTAEEIQAQHATEEQAKFDAVKADAPLASWFPYTRDASRPDRRATAIARMTANPTFTAEMKELISGPDTDLAAEALRLLEHLPHRTAEWIPTITEFGQDLARRIRTVNATTPEQDPSYEGAADVSVRFSAWMVAVQTLREKAGADFTPELRTILELSRVRPESRAMQGTVCRVASYYMKEWTGLEPLPTDPKPR
jgi:hypothetical protein